MKIRKNGKVITLTESDLKRIVRTVINENADPKEDLVKCCENAGIKPPMDCVSGDVQKCITAVSEMVMKDPIGVGTKAITALNCLKDKANSPVMN